MQADFADRGAARVELLAPAGDLDCIRAAVAGGADAVYFGLTSGFNARARAGNITPESLPDVLDMLHRHATRGYLAFNTLVFADELPAAERALRHAIESGVDAIIVQDLGVARLVRALSPDVPLHASTQMTLSSAGAIAAVESLGIQRVILPRELSLEQIGMLRQAVDVELEVFVHGALCISYGGQCLASAALGGRSANRGRCAQPCRLPYAIVGDVQPAVHTSGQFAISPQDLAALRVVPDLLRAGVSSLKIEGRLKPPEYVACVARVYREALDHAARGSAFEPSTQAWEDLEQLFSRGFCEGWLTDAGRSALVRGEGSAKQGLAVGRVDGVRGGRIGVRLLRPLRRGDGIVARGDAPSAGSPNRQGVVGGRVFEIFLDGRSVVEATAGQHVELALARGSLRGKTIRPGDLVWKTHDPLVEGRTRWWRDAASGAGRVPLDLMVSAEVGSGLRIEGQAANGARCRVVSDHPLAAATHHSVDEELLRQQLGRLGGSPYVLRELRAAIGGSPMVPLSVLGAMRRAMLEQLTVAPPRRAWTLCPSAVSDWRSAAASDRLAFEGREPRLHVLCRAFWQVEAVLALGVHSIVADLADLPSLGRAARAAQTSGATVFVATPRILKPGEEPLLEQLAALTVDGILARNLAALAFCRQRGIPVVADAFLNAANPLTVTVLRSLGATRVTTSHDLNVEHIDALLATADPGALEVVAHQHMPLFHMDYCLFTGRAPDPASTGRCDRRCHRGRLRLRDRMGKEHAVLADSGCRSTVFSEIPQSAVESIPRLLARGIRDFRVELTPDLSATALERLVAVYRAVIHGEQTGQGAWDSLGRVLGGALTRGTFRSKSP